MKLTLWARRAVYLCALLTALAGQMFDVGWIFHYIFFLTLTLPLLSLLLSLPGILGLRLRLAAAGHQTPRNMPASWSLTAGTASACRSAASPGGSGCAVLSPAKAAAFL